MKSHFFQGETLPAAFYDGVKKHRQQKLFFTKKDQSWHGMTYGQSFDYILHAIAGLQSLGFSHGDCLCIFSENRWEWILTDYASQWLGGTTTAIYTTSSPEQIEYILNESQTKVLVVSSALLPKMAQVKNLLHLKAIVCLDPLPASFSMAHRLCMPHHSFVKN